MAKSCIDDCITDNTHVLNQRAYVNLKELLESDGDFSWSTSFNSRRHTAVVDGISCRQLYLRSYTFTRRESVREKTKKCFDKVGAKAKQTRSIIRKFQAQESGDSDKSHHKTSFQTRNYVRMAKDLSCALFLAVYQRLLSCSTMAKIDVDHDDH